MATYCVTRSCGHEEDVKLFGRPKDREWRISAIEEKKMCAECHKADLERQNEEAAQDAQEMGFPALEGTEKQIAWAERIRMDMLKAVDSMREDYGDDPKIVEALYYTVENKTKASWWIDNRGTGSIITMRMLVHSMMSEMEAAKEKEQDALQDAVNEAVTRPAEVVTETVAEISVVEREVQVSFPERNDAFREIMRAKRMRWNPDDKIWARKFETWRGPVEDRAAELGHLILAAGIPVRIYDGEVWGKAITESYEPEHTNWIVSIIKGEYAGWFGIRWDKPDDYYKAARKLRGSKWARPYVAVPPAQFESVQDFAEMYDFRFSDGAQKVLKRAKDAKERALTVSVEAPEQREAVVADMKIPKLDDIGEVDIDESLRDED